MTNEWNRRVLDVVIHRTGAVEPASDWLVKSNPPIDQRIDLDDELWIGKIESKLANRVMDACEPPGSFHHSPIRQYGQLYAYVRERIIPLADSVGWDEDSRLQSCVAVSRLLHPTTVSFEYAARVVVRLNGELDEIFPGPVSGLGSEVWLPKTTNYRNWLVPDDLAELRAILRKFPTLKGLPERVSRALWYFEYAARTYYLDVRWTLVCIGLEALVHTDRKDSTKQFTNRISQMAREVGVPVTVDDAKSAYESRSSLAHGQGLLTPPPRNVNAADPSFESKPEATLYGRFEDILRHAVLLALRNRDFREIFLDGAKIRKRWPVT